ncbi:MAG: tetratricopeptide repeat protein, partial [Planctomycetaceae bacterium]|nr:tetratricopeptide repeat protein [Planctomycetaceae bacterium]
MKPFAFSVSAILSILFLCQSATAQRMVAIKNATSIKVGERTIATVKSGEQVWAYNTEGDWTWIKHPSYSEKGWIPLKDHQNIQQTAQQKEFITEGARLQKVAAGIKTGFYSAERNKTQRLIWENFQKAWGDDHPNTAVALVNYGIELDNNGEYQKSIQILSKCLPVVARWKGTDDHDYLLTLEVLSAAQFRSAQYKEALKNLERAIQIRETHYKDDIEGLAKLVSNLGVMYEKQGNITQARILIERSIKLRTEALGPSHKETLTGKLQLAALLNILGDIPGSKKLLEEIIITNRKLGREEEEQMIDAQFQFMQLLQNNQEWDQAVKIGKELMPVVRRKYRTDHPLYIKITTAIALQADDDQAAAELARESFNASIRTLGPRHPQTLMLQFELAALEYRINKRDVAVKALRELVQIYDELERSTERRNTDDRELAQVLSVLGIVEADSGNWKAAAAAFDRERRLSKRFTDKVLPGLSQQEQLRFLTGHDAQQYHQAIGIMWQQRTDDMITQTSLEATLNRKALVQETLSSHERLLRQFQGAAKKVAESLFSIRRELASLTLKSDLTEQQKQNQFDILNRQEQTLIQQLGLAGTAADQSKWVTLQEVRNKLPADSVLVEFVRLTPYVFEKEGATSQKHRYAAWIIPPAGRGSVKTIDLGTASEIEATLRTGLQSIQKGAAQTLQTGESQAKQATQKLLQALFQQTLQPLLPHLQDYQQVILAPDASLWLVPWAALPLDENRFAVEQFEFRYVVSGRELLKETSSRGA